MKALGLAAAALFAAGLLAAPQPAEAQNNNPFGSGFAEGMQRAAEAAQRIERVTVEVGEITVQDYAVGRLWVGFTVSNEASQIAGGRTGYCVRVQVIQGESWHERCTYENPVCALRCYAEIEVGSYPSSYWVKAKVRVRYYGSGGAYTSWSPEFMEHLTF